MDLRSSKAERSVLIAAPREGNEYSRAPICTLNCALSFDALSNLMPIHLFNKQLSSACHGPGIVLGSGNAAGSKTGKTFSAIIEFTFYVEMGRNSK